MGKTPGKEKTMYNYSHNIENASPAAESIPLSEMLNKWQNKALEDLQTKLLAASEDLHQAYDLMKSALELTGADPTKPDEMESLKAAKEVSLKYWKIFESIADFSDTQREILASLRNLFQKEEFPSEIWGIPMGLDIAADVLRKSGVQAVTVCDEDTGDRSEIYNENSFSVKFALSNLLSLLWHLARRYNILETAGPVCFDLERMRELREGMLAALNDMMEAEPEEFPMNGREYFKCLAALQTAMQAERMLEEQAKSAFVSAHSMEKWKNYCRSYEGSESRIAILNALRLCPLDILY